jgi:1-acyl-sn-glycerol-3-phosphate acyltransferase
MTAYSPASSPLPVQAPPGPPTPPLGARQGLAERIRTRLAAAAALETSPPERFGFRYPVAARLFTVTALFHRWYFRVETHGIDRLPRGRVMLVANHGSHVLAWDGAMIVTSCLLDAEPPRLVHGMGDHRLMQLPILGRVASRIGAVDGRRQACSELLQAGAAVLTFPEGTAALGRPFRDRYHLRPFGHGFVHVALATGTPIVPVAVIGAEEEAPILANPRWLSNLLRTPVAPLAPTLFVPLPAKYRLYFGVPIHLRGPATPDVVSRHVATVRAALEDLIRRGLDTRRHAFF